MSRFSREDPVFNTERPFREGYQPDELREREEELDRYASALNPVLRGEPPTNIFLYGKTGVGKTAATRILLDELQEEAEKYDDIDLSVFHVSCRKVSSSYQAAIQIINKIRETTGDDRIPTTGYPRHEVFNMLFDELDKVGGSILIVLDEVDNIGDDDDLLYELPRANANGELSEAEPGIIGISNDFQFKEKLSPEVKGTLCDEEIQFDPYEATELRSILRPRAEEGFRDGVLEPGALHLCAALAAKDSGSARQALRLLHKAGDIVRNRDGRSKITDEDVREAQELLEQDRVEEGIRELTTQGHLVLCAVLDLSLSKQTPAKTTDVYERYEEIAERIDESTVVKRRMSDRLNELNRHGIVAVDTENTGPHDGRYHEYKLDVDVELVLSALDDSPVISDLADIYRDRAERFGVI